MPSAPSFRSLLRSLAPSAAGLLLDMIRTARGTDPAIVLVVDDHTAKILSSCLRMYDIMESGTRTTQ